MKCLDRASVLFLAQHRQNGSSLQQAGMDDLRMAFPDKSTTAGDAISDSP
jgi:hypothetical protein